MKLKITASAAAVILAASACGSTAPPVHHAPRAPAAQPASSSPAPAAEAVLTCQYLAIGPVATDVHRQASLQKTAGGSIPADILAGAWTPPGTYSSDLNSLLDSITSWGEANTTDDADDIIIDGLPSSVTSQPPQLTADINAVYAAAGWVYSPDADNPATAYWSAFESALHRVMADCTL